MANKVCILWHCPYPWDIRIEKMCRSFINHRYEVSIICRSGNDNSHAHHQEGNSPNIYRVAPPTFYNKRALTFPLFFNPTWVRSVRNYLHKIKPDILIIRDIPLALLGGLFGRRMGIVTMLDMAENYPAALVAYNNKLYNPFLFRRALLARAYEKTCLNLMTHIAVVCEEQKERLNKIGINRKKITVINNTPDLKYFDKCGKKTIGELAEIGSGPCKLIYIGKIDAHRGVDVLIRGAVRAHEKMPFLSLTLVGSGTEVERLRKLTDELGAKGYIHFAGWVQFDKVPSFIQSSHIGVIPHIKSEHTDTTIPNKLFDYMAFAKPIISANIRPVKKIINDVGCGKIFESENYEELADKILEVCGSKQFDDMGRKGYQAIVEKYNWQIDEHTLVTTIKKIIQHTI